MAIKIKDAAGPDTQTKISTRSHDRDEDQLAMDARVKALVTEWTAAGKPAQEQAPYRRLTVAKDDRSELKRQIRRATVLAKVDPLYWDDTKPNEQGEVTVKFTVGPQKVKANGSATATAPVTPPEQPPADPNADQGGEQPQAQGERGGLLRGRR